MSRLLTVVALLLVAAMTGWFLLSPPPRPTVHSGEVASPGAVPARAAVAEREVAPPGEPDTFPALPASPVWVEVTVVDAVTGQPVEGADAAWRDDTLWSRVDALPVQQRDAYYDDRERIAREFGWHGRSDARGHLRLHAHRRGTEVFARAADRFGSVEVDPEDSQRGARLQLASDRTLRVCVIDHQGTPAAEVPVEIIVSDPADADATVRVAGSPTTDRDGRVTFRHLQQEMEATEGLAAGGAALVWRAVVRLPGIVDCWQTFDPRAPPVDALKLMLPPTGVIVVHFLYRGGPVERARIGVSLQVEDADRDPGWTSSMVQGGLVRLGFVPLSMRFLLAAHVDKLDLEQAVVGPGSAGQEVHVYLSLPDECVVLTGRVLHPDGRAVADTSVGTEYRVMRMVGSGDLETDRTGRFFWILGRSERSSELERLMVRMDGDAGDKLRAAVPPRPLVAGTNDVGDIQLAALPLVVAGRFVFDRPRSQRDVGFAVECRADTSGPDGQTSWRPLEELLVDRDDDGGFRVHGEVPPLPLRLAFPAADHLPVAPIGFAPGTTGLEVPIELGNSLLVHALLPECLAAGSLSFELLPAVPPTTGSDALDRMHGETGDAVGMAYARWPALPAGVYTLQVRSRGCADLLAAFQDLRVPDPGNEDQTVEIDLRERLHVLRVNVVLSGSSDHDPDAVVILDPVAGELPSGAHIARDGMLCLPVPPRPVDLLVGCEGWRPQTVRAAQGPVEVRLEPWPRVALLVRGLPDLPADGAVWVSLRPTEPTERRLVPASRNRVDLSDLLDAPRHSLELHHDGVGELPIGDAPRRIEVMLNLGSRWCVLQATTPEVVQPGDASVTVQLSTAAVQQAILGLQTRK